MKVLKFGGTSMADEHAWKKVLRIVTSQTTPVVVVVSATSKTTNNLLLASEHALKGETVACNSLVEEIKNRHLNILNGFLQNEKVSDAEQYRLQGQKWINEHIAVLERYLSGIATLNEMTSRSLDMISSLGEQLSSYLITLCGQATGMQLAYVDARDVLKTNSDYGKAIPDLSAIESASQQLKKLNDSGVTPVVGGFYGSDRSGITTTLGRGGSDYSASLFGLVLQAECIEIWTDVSGIYTCDPRMVPSARSIPQIRFNEAAELAYFGAKVLHPATIQPAVDKNIPVVIKNTFDPDHPGTTITRHAESSRTVRAIAFKKDITVVTIHSSRMLLAHGFLAKVFSLFEHHKISVDLITTSEVSISMTVDQSVGLEGILADLKHIGSVRVLKGLGLICLVGYDFLQATGIASKVFSTLEHIPIKMISQGSSDINLSLVVGNDHIDAAVEALHAAFFD